MKITYKTAAQSLLILAASVAAVSQSEVNPDHFADESPAIAAPRLVAQVQTLQGQMEDCQRQLQEKSELVEKARQEAISAAAQGDGAAAYIDAYRQQQTELEALKASLTPQIKQAQKLIAGVSIPSSPDHLR